MIKFDYSLAKTFQLEGGYADIKGDTGGKTRYGITWKVARRHGYKGDMKVMPKSLAVKIYLTDYFDKIHGFALKWQEVTDQVFDHAVTSGARSAGKRLQKAINKYNNNKGLKVDGIIGKGTLRALNKVTHKAYFLSRLIDERELFYDFLALNPLKWKFIKSWRRRPVALLLMNKEGKHG